MNAQTEIRNNGFLGYRLEELIGHGGMGVVYRARDLRLKRTVALKLMAPELAADDRFRERFEREAELAMALEHPNVVPIHDAGELDGQLYLVMRFVEGTDLRALLRAEGVLEPRRALRIVSQVAQALDAAHGKGLVHRDVKPSNVLLDGDEHAYLADFGLTRRLEDGAVAFGDGRSVGTPAYLAPEQLEGRPVDGRADVYSLGCLLYECLTGEPPFAERSRLAVAWAHLEEEPPSACERNRDLPDAVDPVIRTAMAKKPEERYATCRELVDAAEAALGFARRASWRRRALLLAAALVVSAALGAMVIVRTAGEATAALGAANQLVRIDPATNAVSAVIDVGEFPSSIATAGQRVWVYNLREHSVSEIDARTNNVVQTTALTSSWGGSWDAGPFLAADSGGAWVIGSARNASLLTRVESDSGRKREHRVDAELHAVAVGEGAVWVLARDERSAFVMRFDAGTGEPTRRTRIPDKAYAPANALGVGGGYVWAAAGESGTLYRLDPATGALTSRDLGGAALRPVFGFGRVWVCVDGVMKAIDPKTLRDARSGTGLDGEVVYAPGFGSMWRHDPESGTLMRFDPKTGDVAGLTPLRALNRHSTGVTSVAAGANGVWIAVAKYYDW